MVRVCEKGLIGFSPPQHLFKGHAILSKILSLNMVSSSFSSQVWSQRIRQPVFLATVVSVGLHGVIFAAMPFISQGASELEEPESVGVVALSTEDLARLPDFAQNDAFNPANFGDPLVTQDGLSPLAVPEPPPLGDLTTDFDFSDPLSAANLGPPLDLLPPIPVDGGFDSSSFDYSGFDDSGVDDSFFVSEPLPSPELDSAPPLQIPLPDVGAPLDLALEEDFPEPDVDLDPMSPATQFEGELPEGTGAETSVPVALNPTLPSNESEPQPEPQPEPEANDPIDTPPVPPPASLPTAEQDMLAMRDQMRALNRKYASDGSASMDPVELSDRLVELLAAVPAQPKAQEVLEIPVPDDFPRCASDVRSAVFSVLVPAEGGAPTAVDIVQGTGVGALDTIAIETLSGKSDFAGGFDDSTEQPVAARYPVTVTFTDASVKCGTA